MIRNQLLSGDADIEDNLIKVNMKTSLTPANKAEMLRCMFVDGMRNSGIQNKIQTFI